MADNLARIKETIGSCPVQLIAVTKNVEPAAIVEAMHAGVTEFGENRVQEALRKQEQLAYASSIRWHFIGHLQSNKVKHVVGRFALIHSIDSLHLAQEVSRAAIKSGVIQPVLLQVKLVDDDSKSGFSPSELRQQFVELLDLPGVKISGLMTITPLTSDASVRKLCFEGLRLLRDELQQDYGIMLPELSMGMSQDFREAIACGSTMVRLGKAVFGS